MSEGEQPRATLSEVIDLSVRTFAAADYIMDAVFKVVEADKLMQLAVAIDADIAPEMATVTEALAQAVDAGERALRFMQARIAVKTGVEPPDHPV